MTKIIAIVSQKGGVGKTSLVQNLGAELARAGQRILQVDFDPQSNLTIGWGLDPGQDRPTIYDALSRPDKAADSIINLRQNLDLIPANLDLSGAELEFASDYINRNNRLKKVLTELYGYDMILIDGPPSLGFFTINALFAATEIIIPLQTHFYAFRAIDQLFAIIDKVSEVHRGLSLTGIVLTMYDSRNALTSTVEDAARRRFGDLVYKTVIPVNIRIAEAPLDGVSIGEYEEDSKGAMAYKALAGEVLDGKT